MKESAMYREIKSYGYVFEKSTDVLRHLGFAV
jgi:hypothetical protein